MAWRLFSRRGEIRSKERSVRLNAEVLEDRLTPAAMSAYEVSALAVINQMRSNPAAFATDLQNLYRGGNYTSPTGYSASDPIWTDLRAEINSAEAQSTWRSGFNSTGSTTFMSVISALGARAPLVWDSAMQDGAVGHDQWMYTNVYAHSVFTQGQAPSISESQADPIPGITRNFNVATGDYFNYIGLGLNSAGENISYGYNIGGATFQALQNGQISLNGYYQRLVYADVIGFMMEYNNGSANSFGHLENLAGDYNVVGIANALYENPVEGTPDGVAESYFATERFGKRSNIGYANILVYQDLNNNNVYDAGEGLPAQVSFNFGAGSLTLPATGYSGVQLPSSGSYTVSATYAGNNLGSQIVSGNATNKTLTFRVTSLVDATPPVSQVTRLPVYETSPSFLVQWSGTDTGGSGIASYNVYVSVDGGSYSLWQSATTQTQAVYNGALGHRYAFYSTAIDNNANRQATPSGAQASTEVRAFDVNPPANLVAVASNLTRSAEFYTLFVRQAYQTILGRAVDSGSLAAWVDQLSRGVASTLQFESSLIASAEYFTSHGGTNTTWISSLYQTFLGRSPTSQETTAQLAALAAGTSRTAVAFALDGASQRQLIRIGQAFQTYLGRSPTSSETTYWADQLITRGVSPEMMIANLVGSREFFNGTTRGASTNSIWVSKAFQTILQRSASAGDVAAFVQIIAPPAALPSFALAVSRSPESFGYFITQAYQTYLDRSPDTQGYNNWLSAMTSGQVSDERLEAQFIGSPEYIANHGGAGAGWVTGMYVDLLKRTPSPLEVSSWVAQLNAGVAASSVAYGFAASAEREALRVRQNYQAFLGRSPAQSEVNAWVDQFVNHGMTNEIMAAYFVASPEYYRNTAKGNGNTIQWLDAVFADILHRSISLSELLAIAPTIQ